MLDHYWRLLPLKYDPNLYIPRLFVHHRTDILLKINPIKPDKLHIILYE